MNTSGPSILQCPSCGASLLIEGEPTITCQYCGNRVLVPPEYRPLERPQPQPTVPEPTAEFPRRQSSTPPRVIETTGSSQSSHLVLSVSVVAGLILCVGVLLFMAAGGEDGQTSRNISSQNSNDEMPINPQEQAPTALPLPTFTPIAELLLKFGAQGTGQGEMDDARFIAVDPQGNIFVADYSGGRIQKFDPLGSFLMLINVPPPDSGNQIYTSGIGIDSQGRLYVDRNGEILIFNGTDGSLLNTIPVGWPDIYYESLIVAGDFLYTTNGMAGTDDILKLSPQGEILLHKQEVIQDVDKDDPALNMQLAVDPQGQIYILSNFGPHIYVYDVEGNYITRFGEEGNGRGQVDLSTNLLAIDPRGRLYVASSYRIDQFDTQGNYLDYSIDVYDDTGGGVPMGMTFDARGFLYITCNNGKILKYQINSP